jgi:hypothetical protein
MQQGRSRGTRWLILRLAERINEIGSLQRINAPWRKKSDLNQLIVIVRPAGTQFPGHLAPQQMTGDD